MATKIAGEFSPTGQACAAGRPVVYYPPKGAKPVEYPQSVTAARLIQADNRQALLALVAEDEHLSWFMGTGRLGRGARLHLSCDGSILASWQLDEGWEGMSPLEAVQMVFAG